MLGCVVLAIIAPVQWKLVDCALVPYVTVSSQRGNTRVVKFKIRSKEKKSWFFERMHFIPNTFHLLFATLIFACLPTRWGELS